LDSVRIHEGCSLDGEIVPDSRSAITFGEHIYCKAGVYDPRTNEGFALLAHELIHVLQYRKLGFDRLACAYGIDCLFGAYRGCSFEQTAEEYQAAVLIDLGEDRDGICGIRRYWARFSIHRHAASPICQPVWLTCCAGTDELLDISVA
jgi:hypothetical protein